MGRHTQGPWRFSQAKGKVLAYIAMGGKLLIFKSKISDDDARLIAAAPDLLEALENIVNDYCDRFDMTSPSTNPGMKTAVQIGRAAIAKARGEA